MSVSATKPSEASAAAPVAPVEETSPAPVEVPAAPRPAVSVASRKASLPNFSPELPAAERAEGNVILKVAGVFLVALTVFGTSMLAYWAGQASVTDRVGGAIKEVPVAALPEGGRAAFETALQSFREGRLSEAEEQLDAMETLFPGAPAVSFLRLLVAMQDGRFSKAGKMADLCLAADYRRSDVLAVQAAMAALANPPQPDEQRRLLEQAVLADPMNPAPFIELAGLARFLGDEQEAADGLSAAALRFQPAVSLSIVRTIAALAKSAPSGTTATGNPEHDFPAALSEFRAGRRDSALAILRSTRASIDPDTFFYVLNDPAFRPHLSAEQIRALLEGEFPSAAAEVVSSPGNKS